MKRMGNYCKAYPLAALRRFAGWSENPQNARPTADAAGAPRTLDDECIVYLQENHSVTDGIFLEEYVIFDAVTPAWIAFCRTQLGFAPSEAMRPSGAPPGPA